VSNVLSDEKRKQVIALGQPGWPVRRIEKETGVRRETAAGYLKAAQIAIRSPGGWGKRPAEPKPANEVTTDPVGQSPPEPAIATEVTTGSGSDCEPYSELIQQGLNAGRTTRGRAVAVP